MRVTSLDGALLDFWVAKSENLKLLPGIPEEGNSHEMRSGHWHPSTYHPSTDWSQGGEIVSNEWYAIEDALIAWFGHSWPFIKAITESPLKWFMRAYVKTKFGDEVEELEFVLPVIAPTIQMESTPVKKRSSLWFGNN
ncbi:MAG: hypothetical protein H6R14_329 [Proteobacteria bacterium]|nr:hypothetical protein [Pseudomonadota bacterium]